MERTRIGRQAEALGILLCLLAAAPPAAAFDEAEVRAMVLNEIPRDTYPGQPAVWMGRHRDVRLDGTGSAVVLEHWVVRVFDPDWAKQRFAPLRLPYWSGTQGIHLDRVRVWHGIDEPRDLPRGECSQDRRMTEIKDGNAGYVPLREVVVQVPKVQSGDVIELQWRLIDNVQKGELSVHGAVYEFGAAEPVIEEVLSIYTPTALDLSVEERGEGLLHRSQGLGDTKVDTWVLGNLPPTGSAWSDGTYSKCALPDAPGDSLASQPAHVAWSVLTDWNWTSVYYGRRFEWHGSQRSSVISLKVSQLTAGAVTDAEKATRLERWVQDSIGVLDVTADLLGLRPRDASEVMLADVATARDKALLLYSMLRAAGLRGIPALVRARGDTWDYQIVAPTSFDRYLVRLVVQDGAVMWLDPLDSHSALPAGTAFLMTPKGEDDPSGLVPFPGRSAQ